MSNNSKEEIVMALWDTVKGFANEAANTLGSAAKGISDGAKEMSDKSKLKKAIKTEEQKIENAYKTIGERVFMQNNIAPSGFEQPFAEINSSLIEKERLQKELDKLEAATKCPNCGAKISKEQRFCQSCGARQS